MLLVGISRAWLVYSMSQITYEKTRDPGSSFAAAKRYVIALWAATVTAVFAYLIWAIWFAPRQLTLPAPSLAELGRLPTSNRIAAELSYANAKNAVRATLIEAAGGAAFLATAFFAWRQLVVSRLGQLTERFSRSIDQIGETSAVVRLGAVYTLEQMSGDDRFKEPIARVLAAYVRQPPRPAGQRRAYNKSSLAYAQSIPQRSSARVKAALDVQQAATIVITKGLWKRAIGMPIDLAEAELIGVDLAWADLTGSILRGADLRFANLERVSFEGADLQEANLSRAYMAEARLSDVVMHRAQLAHSDLRGAYSERGLRCTDANLEHAVLMGAKLVRTDFTRCCMRNVEAQGAILIGAVFVDADLSYANFTLADLTGANFNGANLSNVIWGDAKILETVGIPSPHALPDSD